MGYMALFIRTLLAITTLPMVALGEYRVMAERLTLSEITLWTMFACVADELPVPSWMP